jgi:hypothetical protein
VRGEPEEDLAAAVAVARRLRGVASRGKAGSRIGWFGRWILGPFLLMAGLILVSVRHGRGPTAFLSGHRSASTSQCKEPLVMRHLAIPTALLASTSATFAQELVVNGDFETVGQQNCGWVCVGVGENTIAGWSVILNSVDRQRTAPPKCQPEGWMAFSGEFSVDLNGCSIGGMIEQSLETTVGVTHRLSFALTVNAGANGLPTEGRLRVHIGSDFHDFTASRGPGPLQEWTVHTIDFTAKSSVVSLRFESLNRENPSQWAGPVIDAISVQPIHLCAADVIENGVVDGADLSAVLAVWGTDGGLYPRADTNGDGVVDGQDLATVLGGWGPCGG